MKVGVLTFHRASNYGSALQAFALVEILRRQGIQAELMDYRPAYIERTLQQRRLRDADNLRTGASIVLNLALSGKEHREKLGRFRAFFGEMPCAEQVCMTLKELEAVAQRYDVIISGSDQLWNENITGEDLAYFFPFFHRKKISYASSFGVDGISEERMARIGPLLDSFHWISLREAQGIRMVRQLLPARADRICRVADPTLLLDADEWRSLCIPGLKLPEAGYILTYYMIETPVLRALTKKLQKQTGLPVVNLKPSKRQLLLRQGINLTGAGPREFLSCYAGAKYVVTNSFHGTAFAINFSVPMFVSPLPKSMAGEVNSRLTDLLEWYGLSDRWMDSLEKVEKTDMFRPLIGLEERKKQHRDASVRVLKEMLGMG